MESIIVIDPVLPLLQKLIDDFILPVTFNPTELRDINESAANLIDDIISSDFMRYIQPEFHDTVVEDVLELLKEQIGQAFMTDRDRDRYRMIDIDDELEEIVEQAMTLFYTHVAPRRAYATTLIRTKNVSKAYLTEKISYLQNVPQPDQRTAEWYFFRHRFLTASSIWKVFGSQSTKNQLIYDKCKPLNVEKYSVVSIESPMHWGHKYEPVSIQYYEQQYNTKVSDFGCIPHRTVNFLAASPDGINTALTSQRYGRMLEVKNIVNREIDGNPKMEYWIQMQLQMEVCELNECDFLETRFTEYESEEAFLADCIAHDENDDDNADAGACADAKPLVAADGKKKGAMMFFIKESKPFYIYAPLTIVSNRALAEWEETTMDTYAELTWNKTIYWKLAEVSCVLVLRNKPWFSCALPLLADFWQQLEYDKVHGYEHRSPQRRLQKDKPVNGAFDFMPAVCLLSNIVDNDND